MHRLRQLTFAVALLGASAGSGAAQVTVVEADELPEGQVVERGYVRGQGRGIQYGAHLASPVYLTRPERGGPMHDWLDVGAGLGVLARIGWEFPLGFTIEVFGGIAGNYADNRGAETSDVFLRADAGAGLRYLFWNDTAFVPFVQAGAGLRWVWFDWPSGTGTFENDAQLTGAVHGALGAQIELSPYFGVEAGLALDYMFPNELFAEGLVSLLPFAGVTLYLYDESDGS